MPKSGCVQMKGEILAHLEVTFVTGFRQRLPECNYCGFHRHEVTEIVYHPSGSGMSLIRGEPAEIRFLPGSVVIYPPGLEHDQRMETGGEDQCLIVQCRLRRRPWPESPSHLPALRDLCVAQEIASLCLMPTDADVVSRRVYQARATAVVCALAAETAAAQAGHRADLAAGQVQEALRYIDEHLQTVAVVDDVARAVGLSGEHLRHVFARQTGGTLSRYLVQARVRRATELLRHTTLPLKTIATACGFRNDRYLCAVYKKVTGRTPGQQRQELRDESRARRI